MTAIQWGRPPGLRAVPAGSSAAQRGEWCPISPPPGTSRAPPAAAPPTPSPAHRPPTPYSAYLRARRSETGRSIWSTYSAPSGPESASHVVFVSGNSIRGRFLPLAARVVMPVCSANRIERPSRVTADAANWKAPPSAPPAGTHRDQLVRIHGKIVRVQRSGVFEKVPRHPMVGGGVGDIFDDLAPVPAVKLRAALAGGGRFAPAGMAFQRDVSGVHGLVDFEIVQDSARAPGPRAQHPPFVRLPRLPLVDQSDDAQRQTLAAVRLDAAGVEQGVFPAARQDLLLRRRTLRTRVTLFASRPKRRRRSARHQRKCIMAPRQLRIRGPRTSGDAGL